MWQTRLICAGKLKSGAYADMQSEYLKRITPSPKIIEIADKRDTHTGLLATVSGHIDVSKPLFVLDERGKTFDSPTLSDRIQKYISIKTQPVQFVIGPADGLNDDIRTKADELIAFGAMTWPHLLIRIMLLEQIYRAQTIATGHPYHRSN